MNTPIVCAVIVNWNGKVDTVECLQSLLQAKQNVVSLRIVVVDNNSSDGSVEAFKRKFPNVAVVTLSDNKGFGGANNRGFDYAKQCGAHYVWFLNNDTTVDSNALSLVESFRDSAVGSVGSKIYFSKGHEFHKSRYSKKELGHVLWYGGGVIDWKNMLSSHRGVDEVDKGQYDRESETDYISGCSFMVRAGVFEDAGRFDESYFLYFEDVDLSLRIQKLGYKTIYNPRSVVWHKNASSTGGSGSHLHEYYQTRNRIRIGLAYAPLRTKIALLREGMRIMNNGNPWRREGVRDAFLCRKGSIH